MLLDDNTFRFQQDESIEIQVEEEKIDYVVREDVMQIEARKQRGNLSATSMTYHRVSYLALAAHSGLNQLNTQLISCLIECSKPTALLLLSLDMSRISQGSSTR